jgi:hypothetical protein
MDQKGWGWKPRAAGGGFTATRGGLGAYFGRLSLRLLASARILLRR